MNIIQAKFDKEGNLHLVIRPNPRVSQSGKTVLVASTGGFVQTSEAWEGQGVSVSVNATVPVNPRTQGACNK